MKIQINNQEIELSRDAFSKEGQRIIAAQIKGGTPAICELFDITPPTARKWKKEGREILEFGKENSDFVFSKDTSIISRADVRKENPEKSFSDVRKENPEKSFRPIYKENSTEFAADFPRYGWTELFGKIFPNNEKEQAFKEELATFGITVEDYLTKFMIKEEYEESEEEEHYWWRPSAYKLHTARVGFAYGEKFHFIAVRQNGTHIYDPNRRTATKWNIFIRFKSSQCVKMITDVYMNTPSRSSE